MADDGGTANSASSAEPPQDFFDDALGNVRGKFEDKAFDVFVAEWFLEELRMLEAYNGRDKMRTDLGRVWDPRSQVLFEGLRTVGLNLTMLATEFEAATRQSRFDPYPWVFPPYAALMLQGVHAGTLAYWLATSPSNPAGALSQDVRQYVETAVRTTLMFLGRIRSA